MTREDLKNTRIWIGDNLMLAQRLQEALFSLGCNWYNGRKHIKNEIYSIFISSDKELSYASSDKYGRDNFFNDQTQLKEITPQQVFDILTTEEVLEKKHLPKKGKSFPKKLRQVEVGDEYSETLLNVWGTGGDNVLDEGEWINYRLLNDDGGNRKVINRGVAEGYSYFGVSSYGYSDVKFKEEGFLDFVDAYNSQQATSNKQESTTKINTQIDGEVIKVPRQVATITTGERPIGLNSLGKTSRTSIEVRPLSNRAVSGY